jgi:hypothetical protein
MVLMLGLGTEGVPLGPEGMGTEGYDFIGPLGIPEPVPAGLLYLLMRDETSGYLSSFTLPILIFKVVVPAFAVPRTSTLFPVTVTLLSLLTLRFMFRTVVVVSDLPSASVTLTWIG